VVALELATNAEALARMEREAQAAATVVHPNVLEVIDVVRCRDGRPCLVTELLEGEELGAVLEQKRPISALEAVDICRQACRALAAAHEKGIVHRDIKPENLFLCRPDPGGPPIVKVLDFGVAKMTDGANLTRLGTVVGTPAYMAPEQARGGPGVDARADVYGIAAVLYHLLTGARPFDDEDPARALARVVTDSPRRMSELNPAIPKELEAIVGRAMEKDAARRTPSARALEQELAGFVKSVEERIAARAAERAVEERLAQKARPDAGQAPPPNDPGFAIRARSAPDPDPWIPVGAAAAAAVVVGLVVREIAQVIGSGSGPMPLVDLVAVVLGGAAGVGAFVGLSRGRAGARLR